MKKKSLLSPSLLVFLALVLLNCDKKKDEPAPGGTTPPTTVSTAPALDKAAAATIPSDITAEAAKVSSTISANGGAAITQYGHVWSDTKTEPTTTDPKTELGKTDGPFPLKFTSDLKSLKANTTYNVRAYATNDKGTTYGTAVQVKTTTAVVVAGEINGTWVERAKFPGSPRGGFKLVSANNKLYLIAGYSRLDNKEYYDAWEYDPATDKWTEKAKTTITRAGNALSFPQVSPLVSASGKIFFPSAVGPSPKDVKENMYEFDPIANTWTVKGALPNFFDLAPSVSFVINDKAYFVGNFTSKGVFVKEVWEYDIPTDKWLQKGDFPGNSYEGSLGVGVSYKGKGLAIGMLAPSVIGTPYTGATSWSYDPVTDKWATIGQQNVDFLRDFRYKLGFDPDKIVQYDYQGTTSTGISPQVLTLDPFKLLPTQATIIPFPQSCNTKMYMKFLHVGQRTFVAIEQMDTDPSKWTACEKETGGKLYELVKK